MATSEETKGQSAKNSNDGQGKRRQFPRYSVKNASRLAQEISKQGTSVKRDRICGLLEMSSTSSNTNSLFAAARWYGLIESDEKGFFHVTSLGKRVCADDNAVTTKAIAEANRKFNLFNDFLRRFADKMMPSANAAVDHIMDGFDLTERDAKTFFKIFTENAEDGGLVQQLPGGQYLNAEPPNSDMEPNGGLEIPTEDVAVEGDRVVKTPDPARSPITKKGVEMHFNIQIHLPETTDPNVYDAIFKSINEHLLEG